MAKKIVNGIAVDMDPAEESAFEADRIGTLASAQARARRALAVRRIAAESAGFTHNGKRYASSASVVGRTAMLAQLDGEPGPFSIDVDAEDGTVQTMTIVQYQAYRVALAKQMKACAVRSSAILAAIAAAQTPQEALAVDMETGWPL